MALVRNRPQVLTVPSARHIQHAQDRIRNAFDRLWDEIQPDVDGPDSNTIDGPAPAPLANLNEVKI